MADAKLTTIYGLVDPRTGHVRYVGKTVGVVSNRVAVHVYYAPKTHTRSARWICGLLADGLRPEAFILDVVLAENWQETERFWIAYLRFLGFDLTNHAPGGEGRLNYSHTPESIAKMRIAQKKRFENNPSPLKGRARPPEVVAKILAAKAEREAAGLKRKSPSVVRSGFVIPDDVRAKISAANKGKAKPPRSAEHCRKISEANKGRVQSQAAKDAVSRALKGRKLSDEHRLALSIGRKAMFARKLNGDG
jgi:hypothetical protein